MIPYTYNASNFAPAMKPVTRPAMKQPTRVALAAGAHGSSVETRNVPVTLPDVPVWEHPKEKNDV